MDRRLILALALLAGCPRGGPAPTRPVTVTVALAGAAPGEVHGVDVTLALPAGATVAHQPATGRLAPSALRLLGGAAGGVVDGTFVPHRKAPSVRLLVASPARLADGDLVAVAVDVPGDAVPEPGAFAIAGALASGPGGRVVPTGAAWISAVAAR
ncbi:MAG TPA: hypothetical protein VFP50_09460 [Anaeromyxobacteraceae bacterium]|nr:hypothetical protein [Anaeromyxobacteraceae bacterium]